MQNDWKKEFKKHHPSIFKFIKEHKKILNEISILINCTFILIVFFEFFIPDNNIIKNIQIFLWLYFLLELYLRMKFHNFNSRYIFSFINIIDSLIILLIFFRFYYFDNTLLHFITALKVFRSYRVIHELSKVSDFFLLHKELIISVINLLIFIFFMSSLVFTFQYWINPSINNFLDSIYFTVATLTTTWFWDIVVYGEFWKFLVIIIMTLWVWLFLRLVTVVFRPVKKYYKCPHCWLKKHESDATHCKHCWKIIYLEHSGNVLD